MAAGMTGIDVLGFTGGLSHPVSLRRGRRGPGLRGGKAGSLLRQQGLSPPPCLMLHLADFPFFLLPARGHGLSIYGMSDWCWVLGVRVLLEVGEWVHSTSGVASGRGGA